MGASSSLILIFDAPPQSVSDLLGASFFLILII
jgi:hypothetical protein